MRFPIMIAVSLLAFIGVLLLALRARPRRPALTGIAVVAAIVVLGGMGFAKLGAESGWPIWVYYGAPAVLTWLLPPLVFRMARREGVEYLAMAVLVAPLVHAGFSLLLGWKEYLPFIPIPSLRELLG